NVGIAPSRRNEYGTGQSVKCKMCSAEELMRTTKPVRVERILDAAAHLFAERHYHQVRVEDVAAKAGVSKGAVYLYFKDKDDLYLALILHGMQGLLDGVRKRLQGLQSPEEKLLPYVNEVFDYFAKAPHLLELILRAAVSESASQTAAVQQSRAHA